MVAVLRDKAGNEMMRSGKGAEAVCHACGRALPPSGLVVDTQLGRVERWRRAEGPPEYLELADDDLSIVGSLIADAPHPVRRRSLAARVWPADTSRDAERAIGWKIKRLCKALAPLGILIEVVPNRGWRIAIVAEDGG